MNIFIAEDNRPTNKSWALRLRNRGHFVVSAFSLQEAVDLFPTETWGVAILDGCLDSKHDPDYKEFLILARQTFDGPILAASMSDELCDQMIVDGCTHKCSTKGVVPDKALEIIEELRIMRQNNEQAATSTS